MFSADTLQQALVQDYGRLCALADRILQASHLAQDAVQESWLRLNRARPDTTDAEKLRHLLQVTVRQTALNMRRRRRAEPDEPVPRRPDRRHGAHDERHARRLHQSGEHRQPERIHHRRTGPRGDLPDGFEIEDRPPAPARRRSPAAAVRHLARPQHARRLGAENPAAGRSPKNHRLLRGGAFAGRNPAVRLDRHVQKHGQPIRKKRRPESSVRD